MAKYDWKQLEKEYILSNYKTVADFLKSKNISRNGSTQKNTKGWNEKKVNKELKKSEKVIEKVIEKESEKEAQQIVDLKAIANDLALNVLKANKELHIHMDMFGGQHEGIVDAGRLKKLTSALKDLNDILQPKQEDEDDEDSFIEALNEKTEAIWNEEE